MMGWVGWVVKREAPVGRDGNEEEIDWDLKINRTKVFRICQIANLEEFCTQQHLKHLNSI